MLKFIVYTGLLP